MPAPDDLKRYRDTLQGEEDGAALYRTLAEREQKPQLAEVYRRLAAEQAYADFWAKRLAAAGVTFGVGCVLGVALDG